MNIEIGAFVKNIDFNSYNYGRTGKIVGFHINMLQVFLLYGDNTYGTCKMDDFEDSYRLICPTCKN